MRKIFSLLLVAVVIQFQTANCSQPPISRIDDLPINVKPIKYEWQLEINLEDDDVPFLGNVDITIECRENTKEIILNVRDLKILKNQVGLLPKDDSELTFIVESQYEKPTKDQYVITFDKELISGRTYRLYVPYKKKEFIDFSDRGYIQYEYGEDPDKPKKIIALTKADINDARRFLPCMDQINLKAHFHIRLTIPETMAAFASIPFKDATRVVVNDKTHTRKSEYEFETSRPISTYSLAIVVAELAGTEDPEPKTNTVVSVFWDSAVSERMDFTRNTIIQVFTFYLNYFKVDSSPYESPTYESPVKALDVLILPNFGKMKTEKPKLIILDETAVSRSDPSDYDNKTAITQLLCYEVCRQWIGAERTMLEWNEYWVQIALVTFLRDRCVEKLLPKKETNLLNWQQVEGYIHVLQNDGKSVSRPVHVPKDDFDLTEAFTDSVLTEKAYVLIRMMNLFLGYDKFQKGIKQYYDNFPSGNSSLDEVWQVFDQSRPKFAYWPKGDVILKTVMDSWTRQKGYPLVTIKRNYETQSVKLTQERFLHLGEEDLKPEETLKNDPWFIPMRYITQTELLASKVIFFPVNLWLTQAEDTIQIKSLEDELLFINLEINVLCRVQYEPEDWTRIHDLLRNKHHYSLIEKMSRVNLVSDMFALAEVGKLPYKTVLSTMIYLPHELSDYPLMVALNEFNKIRSTLFGTDALEPYDKYMKEILTKIFERDRFVDIRDLSKFDGHDYKLEKLIVDLSCNVGVEECIKQCKNLFNEWVEVGEFKNAPNPIPKGILGIVFCQAIRHGDQAEWSFLLTQYDQNQDQDLRETILTALGCTSKTDSLQTYLAWIINPDKKYSIKEKLIIFSSLASNEKGYKEMKEFIKSQLHALIEQFNGYKGIIGSYFAKLFEVTNTRADFSEVKKLTRSVKDHVRDSENVLIQSMKISERNYLWRYMHEKTLTQLFQNPIDLGITSKV